MWALGDPDADLETWKQHNPYDLAPQLNGVRVLISAGNGDPGRSTAQALAQTQSNQG